MLTIRWKGVTQLTKYLQIMQDRAVPYALRNGLNTAAFEARRMWQREIGESFTIRSPYTQRSIQVERATGTDIRRMRSVVGSTAPFMRDQEEGAEVRGRGPHKAIPGPVAAGQGAGAHRTRLVRAPNKLSAIRAHRSPGRTVQQRWAITIAIARRTGKRDVVLERPKGGKGLFRIGGGNRRRRATLRLLWDVSRGSVNVKPEPTLQRTLSGIQPKLPHMFASAIVEQLRRHKVFMFR